MSGGASGQAEGAGGLSARVEALQRAGREAWEALGAPSRRDEGWKHCDFRQLKRLTPGAVEASPAMEEAARAAVPADACGELGRLVLVNGRAAPALSALDGLPAGLRVLGLGPATEEVGAAVAGALGALAEPALGGYVALNQAHVGGDAVVVHVARGAMLAGALEVLHVAVPDGGTDAAHPRVLVLADEASQVTLVERFVGAGGEWTATNSVTEVVVGPAAVVRHVRVVTEADSAAHVGAVVARVERGGRYDSHVVSMTGGLGRTEVHARLVGEGAEASLDGLYLAGDHRHLDHYTVVDHAAPHTSSRELYKGVADEQGAASFIGRASIRAGAVKDAVAQLNKNLLLSRAAQAHTRPQLEIDNDDVQASHGATVGQLDEAAVFYLMSRGLDEQSARGLLTWAFAEEMVLRLPVERLCKELGHVLAERLAASAAPPAKAAIEEAL